MAKLTRLEQENAEDAWNTFLEVETESQSEQDIYEDVFARIPREMLLRVLSFVYDEGHERGVQDCLERYE